MQEIQVQIEHLVHVAGDLLREVIAMNLIKSGLLMIRWSNDWMGMVVKQLLNCNLTEIRQLFKGWFKK